MTKVIDCIEENSPTVQDELRALTIAVKQQTSAIEDLNAIVMGALTNEKVSKL